MHMSNKVRTTLTLNKDVVMRAKNLDINLSAEAEKGIIDKIREIEFIQIMNKKNTSINERRPGRNLNPSPKLDRLG